MSSKETQLKKFFSFLDPKSMSHEDFYENFEKIAQIVLAVKNGNEQERKDLKNLIEKISAEMETTNKKDREDVNFSVKKDMVELRGLYTEVISLLNERINEIKDGENGKDGEDGKDGKNADESKVIDNIVRKLQPKIDALNDKLDEKIKKIPKARLGAVGGGGFSKIHMESKFIDDETPSGTINGTNKAFTIAKAPNPTASLKVYVNGQKMTITEDYTLSGVTITFVTAPPTTSVVRCDYRK